MVEALFIAIQFADDTVGIMQYVLQDGNGRAKFSATSQEIDAEIARSSFDAEKLPIQGWELLPGKAKELPTSREFRNAWVWRGQVEHDLEKAKAIQKDRIRLARQAPLQALDAEYLRADESKDSAAAKEAIVAQKQILRDLPASPAIESARTVEELKAAWPKELT